MVIGVAIVLFVAFAVPRSVDFPPETLDTRETATSTAPLVRPVKMLFVGDMMFDRGVAAHVEKYGIDSLFAGVEDLFAGNDAVIGNLEGTITTQPSISRKNNSILRFTFDPKFADLLGRMKFTAVSLANNHALDFYGSGFRETKMHLDARGILHFGSPMNDAALSTSFVRNGKNICLIGYHDLYVQNEQTVVDEIGRTRSACSYVVVLPHWGVEYRDRQSARQTELGHLFIDAGADLVIGTHPHVVQPLEIYKNRAIFYSLGNFIFDQGLSFATEHGLIVIVGLTEDTQSFRLIPTTITKGEVSVSGIAEADKVLQRLTASTSGFILTNKKAPE